LPPSARRILCGLLLCAAIGGVSPALRAQQTIVLGGTIVTPSGVIEDGTIAMRGGAIEAVGPRAAGAAAIDAGGIIFPGLVDLHNHITWNALPRWTPPSLTKNRYEWQEMPEYAKALSGPHAALVTAGFSCDLNRYGELKEIVNGATSTVGSIRDECIRGLARNLDFLSELQPGRGVGEEPFRDEVFPFEVRSSCSEQALRDVGQPLEDCALNSGEAKPIAPRASVAHVAEGIDASARREFAMFAAHGYLKAGNNIIHGVGLRAPHFARMAAAGVGLIWSPRSNLELYGRTTDVAAAREAGVTIAIAPDWSPSGSSGMLAELAYVDRWQRDPKNAVQAPFTSQQLVEMVTIVPARLARLDDRIGRLAPGAAADLIVMRRPAANAPAYDALVRQTPADLLLVVVGGTAVFGEPVLMRRLVADPAVLDPITVCGQPRLVNARIGAYEKTPWPETAARLRGALAPYGVALADMVECTP
jgi:5-methylthioadenosine/S-adenosylhomocysteine deaminase